MAAGLGRKSVACIMLLSLRMREFPVDTNVGRICSRMGWIPLDLESPAEVSMQEQHHACKPACMPEAVSGHTLDGCAASVAQDASGKAGLSNACTASAGWAWGLTCCWRLLHVHAACAASSSPLALC